MNKRELGQIIRDRKRRFTSKELEELSTQIMEKLELNPKVQDAQIIMMYYSLPDEVYTHEMVDKLYHSGKTILLPKVVADGIMEIRRYEGQKSLRQGAFGIMEPIGPLYTDFSSIDLAVVPGMSFDKEGNRLGRGKGYYDRFLIQLTTTYKLGVCFDFQKTDQVPCEVTDVKMDEVL